MTMRPADLDDETFQPFHPPFGVFPIRALDEEDDLDEDDWDEDDDDWDDDEEDEWEDDEEDEDDDEWEEWEEEDDDETASGRSSRWH